MDTKGITACDKKFQPEMKGNAFALVFRQKN